MYFRRDMHLILQKSPENLYNIILYDAKAEKARVV